MVRSARAPRPTVIPILMLALPGSVGAAAGGQAHEVAVALLAQQRELHGA